MIPTIPGDMAKGVPCPKQKTKVEYSQTGKLHATNFFCVSKMQV